MATLVAGAAERAFVSIPGWRPMLEPLLRTGDERDVAARAERGSGAQRCGGDGGHPHPLRAMGVRLSATSERMVRAVRSLLDRTLQDLSALSDCHVLLLGDGSEAVCRALTSTHPSLAGRLFATGRLDVDDLSHHVAACDLMLQPYPDGISSRRTSAMVALSHGRAIVTTAGWLTEPMWAEAGAAVLAPVDDPHALAAAAATILFDVSQREEIGRRAAALYDARFDVRHTVAALRALDDVPAPLLAVS